MALILTASQAKVPAAPDRPSTYRIGPWRFFAEDGLLSRDLEERRLEDRAARTLELLCQRRGDIVTQQDILLAVWNGRVVSGNSVSIVIGDLRRALRDDRHNPVYIETLTKRGYRLCLETAPVQDAPAPAKGARMTRRVVVTGAAAVAVGALAAALWRDARPPRVRLFAQPVQNDTGRPDLDRLSRALDTLVDLRLAGLPRLELTKSDGVRSKGLLFRSKLILWNDQPTLSLEAIEVQSRTVIWAGMADGPASALADHTIAQIEQFAATTRQKRR